MTDTNIFKKLGSAVGQVKHIFKKGNPQRTMLQKGCLGVYDAMKNTYATQDKQAEFGKECGYEYDKELSNDNQQVYYNKDKGHLMFSVSGTHNISDLGTDSMLVLGKLKNTDRYRQADMTLKKAKAKYDPRFTTGVGHSLGGSIISKLSVDKAITMNKGAEIGARTRNNETHIRTQGDIVSIFADANKNTTTIHSKNNSLFDPATWRRAHKTEQIKKFNYKVPDS